MKRQLLVVGCVLVAACGGGSNGTPTSPNPPQQNRSPTITAVNANPTFGIASLQVFNFTAVASDPDGDTLSYNWTIGGNTFSGPSQQLSTSAGGNALWVPCFCSRAV